MNKSTFARFVLIFAVLFPITASSSEAMEDDSSHPVKQPPLKRMKGHGPYASSLEDITNRWDAKREAPLKRSKSTPPIIFHLDSRQSNYQVPLSHQSVWPLSRTLSRSFIPQTVPLTNPLPISIDALCRVFCELDPVTRGRIRRVCKFFRYCIDKLESFGSLKGQLHVESQRRFFSVQVIFEEADWGQYPMFIDCCVSQPFSDELHPLFKEQVNPKNQMVSLAQGKRVFEVQEGMVFFLGYCEIYTRESFYTCRRQAGYIREVLKPCLFDQPLSALSYRFTIVQLIFSMTDEGVICRGVVVEKDDSCKGSLY